MGQIEWRGLEWGGEWRLKQACDQAFLTKATHFWQGKATKIERIRKQCRRANAICWLAMKIKQKRQRTLTT